MHTFVRRGLMLVLVAGLFGACTKKDSDKPIVPKAGPVSAPAQVEVPKEVLGWMAAGNPQLFLQRAEAMAGKAGPVPAGSLTAGIAQGLVELGLKDTSVIDLTGPAGLLVLNPNVFKIPMVAALTTKGKDALLKSVKPTWKLKSEKDGVHHLVREVLDTYAVFKGGPDAAAKKIEQSMYLQFKGKTVIVAQDAAALAKAGPVLIERLTAGAPASGLTGSLRMDHMRDAFAMQLAMMPEMLKQQIKRGLQSQPQAAIDPAAMQWMMDWMVDKGMAFVNQTHDVGFAVGLEEQEAILELSFAPEKDSFFATFMAAQKPAPLDLAKALPADAFLAMAINVQWQPIKQDMLEFATEAVERMLGKPKAGEIKPILAEWLEVTGDEIAAIEDFDEQGRLRLVELIRVTDTEKAKAAMVKLMNLMSALNKDSDTGAFGVRTTYEGPTSLGEHAGVAIDQIKVKMDLDSLPKPQADMMRKMYGSDGFVMVYGVFDNLLAFAMGANAADDLKATIDQLRSKKENLTASPVFRSAAGKLDRGAGGYVFISISRLAKTIVASTFAMSSGTAPKLDLPDPKSGMFIRYSQQNGRLIQTLRMPAAHMEELGALSKAITQASMSQ